jgi:adenylate cyclase
MTHYAKKQIRFVVFVVLASSVLGLIFSLIVMVGSGSPTVGDHVDKYVLLGLLTGFFVSLALVLSEFFTGFLIKNPPLFFNILVRPVISALLITGVYGLVYHAVFPEINFWKDSKLLQTIIFSLFMTFGINLFQTLNRLIGQNVLLRLFIGRYHHPVREERFFMFLDMVGSTGIAEKIGDVAFLNLLRDFFQDITEPLLQCRAEIYKYVGDEVILTWKEPAGIRLNNALQVFFSCRARITEKADYYMKKYGLVPGFRAGLHFGPVMVGEMGTYKMEIAYLGDVMNTASRIQSACAQHNVSFLVSGEALVRFGRLPELYRETRIGSLSLRGKERELEIYSLEDVLSTR